MRILGMYYGLGYLQRLFVLVIYGQQLTIHRLFLVESENLIQL